MLSLESQLKSFRPDGNYDKDDRIDALAYQLALWQTHPSLVPPEPTGELIFKQMTMGEYNKLAEDHHEAASIGADPNEWLYRRAMLN